MSTRIVILRRGTGWNRSAHRRRSTSIRSTLFAAGFYRPEQPAAGCEVTSVTAGRPADPACGGSGSCPQSPTVLFAPAVGDRAALCLRPQRVRYGFQPQHQMELQGRNPAANTMSGGMQHTLIALSDRADGQRRHPGCRAGSASTIGDRGVRGLESAACAARAVHFQGGGMMDASQKQDLRFSRLLKLPMYLWSIVFVFVALLYVIGLSFLSRARSWA